MNKLVSRTFVSYVLVWKVLNFAIVRTDIQLTIFTGSFAQRCAFYQNMFFFFFLRLQ